MKLLNGLLNLVGLLSLYYQPCTRRLTQVSCRSGVVTLNQWSLYSTLQIDRERERERLVDEIKSSTTFITMEGFLYSITSGKMQICSHIPQQVTPVPMENLKGLSVQHEIALSQLTSFMVNCLNGPTESASITVSLTTVYKLPI